MTRSARTMHLVAWLLLAPLLGGGLYLALAARPPRPLSDGPQPLAPEETR